MCVYYSVVIISRKRRARLLSSLFPMHENIITVILAWKSSRASSFLSSLPPVSPCHTKFSQSQAPPPLSVLEILPMATVCAVPAHLAGALSLSPAHRLPFLRQLIRPVLWWPLRSPFPLFYKSMVQTSCFQEGSALASTQTHVHCSQPPIPLHAYCLQCHLLHFTVTHYKVFL